MGAFMTSVQAEASRSSHLLVPYLVMPALLGALWMALTPQTRDGLLLLTIGSAVIAWYLLEIAAQVEG